MNRSRDAVRDRRARGTPHTAAWDRDATFPKDALNGRRHWACLASSSPRSGVARGGPHRAGGGSRSGGRDGATSTILSVNNCPVCNILVNYGNAAQMVPGSPLARVATCSAPLRFTEPQAGRMPRHSTPLRRRDGDAYVIDGAKQFITSGKNLTTLPSFAVTEKAASKRGITPSWCRPPHPAIRCRAREKLASITAPRSCCWKIVACRRRT